jgi:hypothetical protein
VLLAPGPKDLERRSCFLAASDPFGMYYCSLVHPQGSKVGKVSKSIEHFFPLEKITALERVPHSCTCLVGSRPSQTSLTPPIVRLFNMTTKQAVAQVTGFMPGTLWFDLISVPEYPFLVMMRAREYYLEIFYLLDMRIMEKYKIVECHLAGPVPEVNRNHGVGMIANGPYWRVTSLFNDPELGISTDSF